MSVGRTFGCHHLRKRMIQYAAAFVLNHRRHGLLGRPVKPGDDSCVWGRVS
jgi:hypothetical protein